MRIWKVPAPKFMEIKKIEGRIWFTGFEVLWLWVALMSCNSVSPEQLCRNRACISLPLSGHDPEHQETAKHKNINNFLTALLENWVEIWKLFLYSLSGCGVHSCVLSWCTVVWLWHGKEMQGILWDITSFFKWECDEIGLLWGQRPEGKILGLLGRQGMKGGGISTRTGASRKGSDYDIKSQWCEIILFYVPNNP